MCERLINGSHYICEDCWGELLAAKESWPDRMTARDVLDTIEKFMGSPVGTYRVLDRDGIEEEFKRITGA
jgi:hypothetical protein